jgi:hypothetical protein
LIGDAAFCRGQRGVFLRYEISNLAGFMGGRPNIAWSVMENGTKSLMFAENVSQWQRADGSSNPASGDQLIMNSNSEWQHMHELI